MQLPDATEILVRLDGFSGGMVGPVQIVAFVVRKDRSGVGVEWLEFAPHEIVELVARASTLPLRLEPRAEILYSGRFARPN
jgi:hypothetical protein